MLEVRQFELAFDQPHGVCPAGGKISGQVILDLTEPLRFSKLLLCYSGKARVHYMRTKSQRNIGAYINNYKTDQNYFDEQVNILYGSDGSTLQAGRHTYPFEFSLPGELPSSYEGKHGHVRYFCKAVIERGGQNIEVKQPFTVLRTLDLNQEPANLMAPCEGTDQSTLSSCFSSGEVEARLQTDRLGYVPGESILITAQITNNSTSPVTKLRLALKQNVHFFGQSDGIASSGGLKSESDSVIVTHIKPQGDIAKKSSGKWTEIPLPIPAIPPSRLDGCDNIRIEYVVELQGEVKGGKGLLISLGVMIGTIPLQHPWSASGPGSKQPLSSPPGYNDSEYSQPPPSYQESVMGRQNMLEEGDSDAILGKMDWAPSYPIFQPASRSSVATTPNGASPPLPGPATNGAPGPEPVQNGNSPPQPELENTRI